MKKIDALYCADFDAYDINLYGTWTLGDYKALDVIIKPCTSEITLFDGSIQRGPENCNWDRQVALDYFGETFSFIAFYNQGQFR